MNNPIFIDLCGNTARVDPQRTQTAYLKLTICTEQQSDDAGNLVSRGQVAEVWITADQAIALADALKSGCKT